VYLRQRLTYVPHNDYDQIQVCSDIVQLQVVDPTSISSHGYIGTTGKKEDTYYKQGCMRQVTNMICSTQHLSDKTWFIIHIVLVDN
jgi:hypothetical protein